MRRRVDERRCVVGSRPHAVLRRRVALSSSASSSARRRRTPTCRWRRLTPRGPDRQRSGLVFAKPRDVVSPLARSSSPALHRPGHRLRTARRRTQRAAVDPHAHAARFPRESASYTQLIADVPAHAPRCRGIERGYPHQPADRDLVPDSNGLSRWPFTPYVEPWNTRIGRSPHRLEFRLLPLPPAHSHVARQGPRALKVTE